jgi:RNA polymerase sigma-70 factor, ECF subfamily
MEAAAQENPLSPQALDRLIASRQQFLGFLRKRLGSEEIAEDILQMAFVKSLEKGGSVRDEETVVAWFYRLLRNSVIDYYRQRGTSEQAIEKLAGEMQTHQEPDVALKGEICGCVAGLMEPLKPEYRQALDTVDLQERSLADLASEAKITPNNAAVRIHRARQALRAQVEVACGLCAEHGCLDCSCRGNVSRTRTSA